MDEIFSKRLRELRESLHLTQRAFGAKAGISPASLSAYEQGIKKPSFDVIIDIARTFDVSTDWLFGLSNNEKTKITETADIIGMLVEISKATEVHVMEQEPVYAELCDYEGFVFITFEDRNIDLFIRKWRNIINLWQQGSIDDELYDLWCKKEIDTVRNITKAASSQFLERLESNGHNPEAE